MIDVSKSSVLVDNYSLLKSTLEDLPGGTTTLVCPMMRFESSSGGKCFDQIFGSEYMGNFNDGSIQDVFVRLDERERLLSMGGGDVSFIYLSGKEALLSHRSVLADISLLVEASRGRMHPKVVVMVDVGDVAVGMRRKLERRAHELVHEAVLASGFTHDSVATHVYVFDSRSVDGVAEARDAVRSIIGEWVDEVELPRASEVLRHLKTEIPTHQSVSAEEADAVAMCTALSEKFFDALTPKMNVLSAVVEGGNMASIMERSADELASIITSALSKVEGNAEEVVKRYGNTKAFHDMTSCTRLRLRSLLVDGHGSIVSSSLAAAKSDVSGSMRRLGPGTGLPQALQAIATEKTNEFGEKAAALSSKISEYFTTAQKKSPLLGSGTQKAIGMTGLLSCNHAVKTLRAFSQDAREERMDTLFLQGAYNPFVRTATFPPLHLNLNYLIDPRSIPFELDHRSHYDVHEDRIAPTKADPLHLPYTARVPFNPNNVPQGKVEPSWWQQLKDFYLDEED